MPTIQEVLSDNRFHMLPPEEQAKVMGVIDPNFAALDPTEQQKVVGHIKNNYELMLRHNINQNQEQAAGAETGYIKEAAKTIGGAVKDIGAAGGTTPLVGGMISGGANILGQSIEQAGGARENISTPEALASMAAPAIGQGLFKLASPVADWLKKAAVEQVGKVLYPTTKAFKYQTKNLVGPELLKQPLTETFAVTREGLEKKAQSKAEQLGQKIESTWEQKAGGESSLQGVIQGLKDKESKFYVTNKSGERVLAGGGIEESGVSNLRELRANLEKLASKPDPMDPEGVRRLVDNVSDESIRAFRQKLDKSVALAGGFSGKTIPEQNQLWARRELSNSLRDLLNQKYPDLAKINAEFHFWRTAADILDATNTRTTGQQGALKLLAGSIGAGVGGAEGYRERGRTGALAGIGIGATTGAALQGLLRSTGWRLASAKTKNFIANQLASGNFDEVIKVGGRMVAADAAQAGFREE